MPFDPFKYKSPLQFMKLDDKFKNAAEASRKSGIKLLGYSFEDKKEYDLFLNAYESKQPAVMTLPNSYYNNIWLKGLDLVMQNKFRRALHAFIACLRYNPVALSARFFIILCYLQLDEPKMAREWLKDTEKYIVEASNIGLYYMYMGNSHFAEGNFYCAIACYTYSLKFSKNPDTATSLEAAKSAAQFNKEMVEKDPETILKQYDIPVLIEHPEVFDNA